MAAAAARPGRPRTGRDGWLRGRPTEDTNPCHPFLKLPGSDRLRTLPDGLWLNFGGTPWNPLWISSRSRPAARCRTCSTSAPASRPSTHSLLAVCPVPWLLAPVTANDPTPRWRATGVLRHEPANGLILPVRDIRVMYALKATTIRVSRIPRCRTRTNTSCRWRH